MGLCTQILQSKNKTIHMRLIKLLKKLLGYCPRHGYFKYPKWYRSNTAYYEEHFNWEHGCKECKKESDDFWDDMWTQIAGRM